MEPVASEVTQLLQALDEGDAKASERLLPLLYDELRRMAGAKMAKELPGQTLQPTALVHEAWLRLVTSEQQTWQNRSHFMGAAAEAMRRVLVDAARRKRQLKRGGEWQRIHSSELDLPAATVDDKILLVDEALEALEALDPVECRVVKLRYFVGLSHAEIGSLLGLSERSVKRYWSFAKVWLYRWIEEHRSA